MQTIQSAFSSAQNKVDSLYNQSGQFLDKNPTIYKAVLIASHLFRMISMFALMTVLPFPLPLTMTLMVAGTLLYRAAIERFCCFRFTIPSMIGAITAWISKASIINFISGEALLSAGAFFSNTLPLIPLTIYGCWIIYSSHHDIKKRMSTLKKPSCCNTK